MTSRGPENMASSLPSVNRKFYELDSSDTSCNFDNKSRQASAHSNDKILHYIEENIVGNKDEFSGPFGLRRALYTDYTASGRSLKFIENYIQDHVLPHYGNTHTTTTVTSLQTTLYRHEARDIVRNAVNASEHDAVVFVGSGCTAAVHKLIHALALSSPPVVFVGPFEHHSNLLPWREVGASIVRIRETENGLVDTSHLEAELQAWKNKSAFLIGCFAAASNVTGTLCDVDAVTVLLHKYNALALWDYATSGPYANIDMNPLLPEHDDGAASKDAVFISTHKFVGGVQTPGILVAKKKLFRNTVPSGCGGGSVFYVRREAHRYLQEVEMREEGGTPAIVESIRAGLVFQLKEAVGSDAIMKKEQELCRTAFGYWEKVSNLVILGSADAPRLPIFSFLIRHPESGRFLHHNFICALLNDLFGIQARGGCACAGPYAQDLMGIDETLAKKIEDLLVEDQRLDRVHLRRYQEYSEREIIRPGFTRLNLPYFLSDSDVDFVLQAVRMVAEQGWKLLPQYKFNPETGEWRHRNHQVFKGRKWLGHVSYSTGKMSYREPTCPPKGPLPTDCDDCLQKAEAVFKASQHFRVHIGDQSLLFDSEAEAVRWFVLPSEALLWLHEPSFAATKTKPSVPFQPAIYPLRQDHSKTQLSNHIKSVITAEKQPVHEKETSRVIVRDEELNKTEADRSAECLGDPNFESSFGEFQRVLMSSLSEGFTLPNREYLRVVIPEDNGKANGPIDNQISRNTLVEQNRSLDDENERIPLNKTVSENPDYGNTENVSEADVDMSVGSKNSNTSVVSNDRDRKYVTLSNDTSSETITCSTGKQSTSYDVSVNDPLLDKGDDKVTLETSTNSYHKGGNCCLFSNKNSDGTPVKYQPTVLTFSAVPNRPSSKINNQLDKGTCSATEVTESSHDIGLDDCKKSLVCDLAGSIQKTDVENNHTLRKSGHKWHSPPKTILKPTIEAIDEFRMIQDGDRVLVCLSGGKDSLSLLHTIRQYRFYAKKKGVNFEFGAMTVDPQASSYDPSPLKYYLAALGVPYFYEEQCILESAQNLPYECASICSFCSRMKRGRIYACARREGYNVLALGQHLDDLAESFMMSIFHNGILRTMKANYTVVEGDLRVIRPFVYVREKLLRLFAEQKRLPVISENCPACFEAPKERHRMKQLLAGQEILHPRLFHSILAAIKPILGISKTGVNVKTLLAETTIAGNEQSRDIDTL